MLLFASAAIRLRYLQFFVGVHQNGLEKDPKRRSLLCFLLLSSFLVFLCVPFPVLEPRLLCGGGGMGAREGDVWK